MEEFKMPHLDKLVGIPKEYSHEQSRFERLLTDYFNEAGEKIEGWELDKTDRDIQLINFAQNAADDYMEIYNRKKKVTTPLGNIHLVKAGNIFKMTKGEVESGFISIKDGNILIDRAERDTDFSLRVFHELIHAKSFNAMQVTKENTKGESKTKEFRVGFSLTSRDGKMTYFDDVNEAVVGFLTKRFLEEYVEKSDIFKDELKEMKEKNIPIDLSRKREVRLGLEYIDKLYELNKDKYSLEEITNIFINAGINGNLLKVARMVEEAFGKGSFRQLGEQTRKIEK